MPYHTYDHDIWFNFYDNFNITKKDIFHLSRAIIPGLSQHVNASENLDLTLPPPTNFHSTTGVLPSKLSLTTVRLPSKWNMHFMGHTPFESLHGDPPSMNPE